eukprot:COSAG03_NODE_1075_length_4882_cov_28.476479_2_plen_94_part_00
MDRDAEIGMEEGAGPAAGERQQSLPRSEDNKGTTPRHTWLLLSSVLHADPLKVRLAFCVARGLLACSSRALPAVFFSLITEVQRTLGALENAV